MLTRTRTARHAIICACILMLASCKEDTLNPVGYGTITGSVSDADNRLPIAGASISTSPPTAAIISDDNGLFTIESVQSGNYTVSVQKNGFSKAAINIAVVEGRTTTATVLLQKSVGNTVPPGLPNNPTPAHQATSQPVSLTLSWSPAMHVDSLRYDVYVFESSSQTPRKIATSIRDTSLAVDSLKYNMTYFWQVTVRDTSDLTTNGPLWSFATRLLPDNRVVFASARNGNYHLFSADTSGGNILQLTAGAARNWWPQLSPRRDKIAYSSDVAVPPHIYTINRDGSGTFKVTTLGVGGYHNYGIGFSWSPDGTKLVYSSYNRLYRVDAVGGNLAQVATAPAGRNFRECAWSPSGDKFVVLTIGENEFDSEIYSMNADGTNLLLLVGNLPGIVEAPAFSVDGGGILYTRDISGLEVPEGRQLDSHIFFKRIAGLDTTIDLSINKPAGTNDKYPRFSPDGSKIIFTNRPNDDSQPADVWMMEANGTGRRRIITDGTMPDWK